MGNLTGSKRLEIILAKVEEIWVQLGREAKNLEKDKSEHRGTIY